MIRDIVSADREIFLSMAKSFYSSSAVVHNVDSGNFEATFTAAMDKSPFIRIFIIEDEGNPIGYALLSFTHSNEAGGLVVWIEEIYISEACRGKGYGSRFLGFVEQEYPSAKRIRLEVRGDNEEAVELYYRLGYEALDYVQMVKDKKVVDDGRKQ